MFEGFFRWFFNIAADGRWFPIGGNFPDTGGVLDPCPWKRFPYVVSTSVSPRVHLEGHG